MALDSLTDEKITELLTMEKLVKNSAARKVAKPGHDQTNYVASSPDGTQDFQIYIRQNHRIKNDYSCGINWTAPSGETVILRRYNGSSHVHPNRMEGNSIIMAPHVHTATQRYILDNKSAEGYAEETDRYTTAEEAFTCLIRDCNIKGIVVTDGNDQQRKPDAI